LRPVRTKRGTTLGGNLNRAKKRKEESVKWVGGNSFRPAGKFQHVRTGVREGGLKTKSRFYVNGNVKDGLEGKEHGESALGGGLRLSGLST